MTETVRITPQRCFITVPPLQQNDAGPAFAGADDANLTRYRAEPVGRGLEDLGPGSLQEPVRR
jgi:hypothetical protein